MTHDSQPQIDESFKQNEDTEACTPAVEEPEWKASKEVFQVLFCLSIIGIMASFDMTIFLPILPVSTCFMSPFRSYLNVKTAYRQRSKWRCYQHAVGG